MEGHSVPKNITDFQFHLVGSMTLKQFLYLASGLGLAYLVFVVLAAQVPLIAWPIIIMSSVIGTTFAFVPYGDRSLDHWAKTYFRAIFKPTQRIWIAPFANFNPQLFRNRLEIYLSSLVQTNLVQANPLTVQQNVSVPVQTTPKPVSLPPPLFPILRQPPQQEPVAIITELTPQQQALPTHNKPIDTRLEKEVAIAKEFFQQTQQAPSTKGWLDLPSEEELNKTVVLAKEAQLTQSKINEMQKQLNEIQQKAATPGADPKKFQEDFQKVLTTLQGLNLEASEISRALAILSKTPISNLTQPKIRIAPKTEPVNKQVVLTTTPNIINGVVTDNHGNYLQGAIVVTHDKQGLPVRALKTNKLGQFIAATPLGNGIYTITIEKDNLLFDILEIELGGHVLPPIKISAKKGGV